MNKTMGNWACLRLLVNRSICICTVARRIAQLIQNLKEEGYLKDYASCYLLLHITNDLKGRIPSKSSLFKTTRILIIMQTHFIFSLFFEK